MMRPSSLASCFFLVTTLHSAEPASSDHHDTHRSNRPGGLDVHYSRWPESVWAPIGDEVSFECRLNLPPDLLKWRYRRLGSGPQNLFVDLRDEGSTLTVKVNDDSVQGDYQCIAWYGSSALASSWGTLWVSRIINGDNVLPRRMLSLSVPRGNPVLLRCSAPDAKPSPTVLYYRLRLDGTEETDSSYVITSRRGGSDSGEVGILPNPTSTGSGDYSCSARAALGASPARAQGGFRLHIDDNPTAQPPRFIEDTYAKELQINTTSVLEGVLGHEARFECGAIGWPVPTLSWTKDGRHLGGMSGPSNSTSHMGRFTTEYGGRLLFIAELRSEDEGVYACTASNGLGSARRSRTLRVLRPANLIRGERTQPDKTKAEEGKPEHMHCGFSDGAPRPQYHWLLNGANATSDGAVSVKGPDLLINRVEKRHAGIVQCFVSNEFGQDSVAFLLTVAPKQISGQPQPSDEETVGALRGASSMDSAIDSPKRHHKGRNGPRKHKGNAVMVPPSRPNVTRLSDESVMVRWSVSKRGLPIQFFKVQYKELSAGSWMTANQDIPSYVKSYSVDGLTPERTYRFRVAAVYSNNDNKLGPTSGRYHLTKGSVGARPAAPMAPQAEPSGPNRLRLIWEYPASAKIRPDGFYCYYRPTSSAAEYYKASAEGPAARDILLPYLLPDTPYELKLQAFTAGAASDFSNIIVARTAKRDPPKNGTTVSGAEDPSFNGLPPRDSNSKLNESVSDGRGGVWAAAGAAAGTGILLAALSLILYKRYKRANSKANTAEKDANIGGGTAPSPQDCHPLEQRPQADSQAPDDSETDRLDREAGSDESTASLADSEEPSPSPPPRTSIPPPVSRNSRPPPYSCKDEIRATQMGHHTPHTHHTYV